MEYVSEEPKELDSGEDRAPYTGRYQPLGEDFVHVQRSKRARHSTGSTPPTSQFMDRSAAREVSEDYRNMTVDEKLNLMLDSMNNIGLLKHRVDNIESRVFYQGASQEVVDERVRLLEYKSLDLETRLKERNLILSGLREEESENVVGSLEHFLEMNWV